MRVIYCALELSEDDDVSIKCIAKLCGVSSENIRVKGLDKCTAGNEKRFWKIADIYLWIGKYWYGLYENKLTFVEIRNFKRDPLQFHLAFSDQLRLAIKSPTLSNFNKHGLGILNDAALASLNFFNEERIEALRPYIPKLEKYFSIEALSSNPFR